MQVHRDLSLPSSEMERLIIQTVLTLGELSDPETMHEAIENASKWLRTNYLKMQLSYVEVVLPKEETNG